MQYKALITGKNSGVIDDFFTNMNGVESMTTSDRYGDVVRHIKYFAPDVFVYCVYQETKEDYSKIVPIKHLLGKNKIPCIVCGSEEDCAAFEQTAVNVSDLTLKKPLDTDDIQKRIVDFIEEWKKTEVQEQTKPAPIAAEKEAQMQAPADQAAQVQTPVGQAAQMQAPAEQAAQTQSGQTAQAQASTEKKKEKRASSRTANRKRRLFGRGRILVIDDNPLMLKVIKEHLHEEYDVATAINGKVALRFLESRSVDLILLDYEMPDQDGPAVLEKLRSMEKTKDIPVIFLTGISDKKKITKALIMKPEGYLLKPIDHDKLMSTIKKFIS